MLRALAVPGWSYQLSPAALAALAVVLERSARHENRVAEAVNEEDSLA